MSEQMQLPDIIDIDPQVRELVLRSSLSESDTARAVSDLGYDVSRYSVARARRAVHRTALILSDWQCDLHDEDFLWRVLEMAKDIKPDLIVHVGDENDQTTIGRWVRGLPEEYEGDFQEQIDITYKWLERFRNLPSVDQMGIVSSNHGLRLERSITSRIPAFRHLRALRYEALMGLEELDIDYMPTVWEFLPGVLAGHGDQWNLTSASQYAQMSKKSLQWGKSIVAGHTHRPMLSATARDAGDLFVMNVGHSMDTEKVSYNGADRGNVQEWCQAVGVVSWDGTSAYPELVMNINGRMHWRGRFY